jgi:hypothetical protein
MTDADPGDDGLEILRDFLARTLEQAEQQAHSARPQRQPFQFYIRRNAHRTLARFGPHAHNRCRR